MSDDLQEYRIDELEKRLDGHESECKERHSTIQKRFNALEKQLTRLNTIIAIAGGALFLIQPVLVYLLTR